VLLSAMTQTGDQQHFTIFKVAADWHQLMVLTTATTHFRQKRS